ncbi:MAG: hypothetical protein ACTIJ9_10025 [Aequorivita sp.]
MTFSISEPIKLDTDTVKAIAVELFNLQQTNKPPQPDPADDLVQTKEACEITQSTPVTLWRWEKKGRIYSYGIGGKKFYKRSELLKAIVKKIGL